MTVRAAVGLAVLVVLATGCGRAGVTDTPESSASPAAATAEPAPSDAVPWDTVDAFHATTRGTYTETTGVTGGGFGPMTLTQETVRFDLDAPYIERTVTVPESAGDTATEPRELRFVYTDTAMFMWHPNTLEQCGTHWIDMTDGAYEDVMGVDLQPGDLLAVRPLEFLAAATGEPRHLKTTSSGSSYEITAPAELGMRLTSALVDDPGAAEAILDIDAVAEVLLPEAGTSLTISADLTEAYRTLDPSGELPADAVIRTAWTLTRDIAPFTIDLPADVADPSCLDPGTAM